MNTPTKTSQPEDTAPQMTPIEVPLSVMLGWLFYGEPLTSQSISPDETERSYEQEVLLYAAT